jgi:aminopeptidase N
MVLQMLREELGDATFFAVLRAWTQTYRHRTATTADFTATASRVSGRNLGGFFKTWLYSPARPALPTAARHQAYLDGDEYEYHGSPG